MYDKPTDLYRHFNKQFRLLYVGISLNAWNRAKQHKSIAQWAGEGFLMTVQTYPDRASALAAEADAIRTEAPLYNVSGKPPADEPKKPKRVIERREPPRADAKPEAKPYAVVEKSILTYRDTEHRNLIVKQSRLFDKVIAAYPAYEWNALIREYAEARGDGMEHYRDNRGRLSFLPGISKRFKRWLRAHLAEAHGFPELAEHSRGQFEPGRIEVPPPCDARIRHADANSDDDRARRKRIDALESAIPVYARQAG